MDKNTVLNFFFPSRCVFCREIVSPGTVCSACREKVEHLRIPDNLQDINHKALKNADKCVSFYYYEGIVRDGILNAKGKSCESFVNVFLQYISFDFDSFIKDNEIDVMVSMPCHKSKFYVKEFDLPQLMAKKIAKNYPVEYNDNLVKKIKRTKNQHKLNLKQRKDNLKDAFAVCENIRGRNILIVDDIISSGYSLEEVAKTLKKSGANKVFAVTFAYNKI